MAVIVCKDDLPAVARQLHLPQFQLCQRVDRCIGFLGQSIMLNENCDSSGGVINGPTIPIMLGVTGAGWAGMLVWRLGWLLDSRGIHSLWIALLVILVAVISSVILLPRIFLTLSALWVTCCLGVYFLIEPVGTPTILGAMVSMLYGSMVLALWMATVFIATNCWLLMKAWIRRK